MDGARRRGAAHPAIGRAPRTLAERATLELQDLIIAGQLPPGAHLRIEELSERLDMSPMPIREALRRLETLGFVDHVPHRGARVRPLSLEDLHDTYAARLSLEALAVRRAAERFTDADEAEAREYLARYAAADDLHGRDARMAHTQFHFALYTASGSQWILRLIRPLFENSERYRITSLPTRGSNDALIREHELVLEGCVAHEPEAAADALWRHLATTANALARQMGHEDIFEGGVR